LCSSGSCRGGQVSDGACSTKRASKGQSGWPEEAGLEHVRVREGGRCLCIAYLITSLRRKRREGRREEEEELKGELTEEMTLMDISYLFMMAIYSFFPVNINMLL